MMTLEQAKAIIAELRGRFEEPFSSSDKATIEALFRQVTGKTFVPTSCQQCYHDAVIEIVYYLKKNKKMATTSNYKLKAGAIINCPTFQGGKVFTNDNLTDEVAKEYLEAYPEQEGIFAQVPVEVPQEPKKSYEGTPEDGEQGAGADEGTPEGSPTKGKTKK